MSWISKKFNKLKDVASGINPRDALAAIMPVTYLANASTVDGARSRAAGGTVMEGVASSASPYLKTLGMNMKPMGPGDTVSTPTQDTLQDPEAQGRAERRRRRLLAAQGRGSTILTGGGSGGSLGMGSGNSILGV